MIKMIKMILEMIAFAFFMSTWYVLLLVLSEIVAG